MIRSQLRAPRGQPPGLDILVADRRRFLRSETPILLQAAQRLERSGVGVRVLERLDPHPSAAVACVHVDLTTVPSAYLWADRLYPVCVNGRARSISRDLYSTARVRRGDEVEGPVFVKTMLNYQGLPELRLMTRPRYGPLGLLRRRFRPDPSIDELAALLCPDYEIRDTIDDVPDEVWDNPHLLVERFVPRTLEPPLIRQRYEFFLDVEVTYALTYDDPSGHGGTTLAMDFGIDTPTEVTDLRRRLAVDSGSIDYFDIDGEVTVIDVNKTGGMKLKYVRKYPELDQYIDAIAAKLAELVETTHRDT